MILPREGQSATQTKKTRRIGRKTDQMEMFPLAKDACALIGSCDSGLLGLFVARENAEIFLANNKCQLHAWIEEMTRI